jgi:hypothetical protein
LDGLVGDEQADRSFHGGLEKAVLHYAVENYDAWHADGYDGALNESALSELVAFATHTLRYRFCRFSSASNAALSPVQTTWPFSRM